jgi:hypothetical protein
MSKLLQGVLYIVFGVFVGYFSVAPAYNYASPDRTSVKLSLSHAANRVHPCTKLSPQEINELAASGERFQKCERERLPLTVAPDGSARNRWRAGVQNRRPALRAMG